MPFLSKNLRDCLDRYIDCCSHLGTMISISWPSSIMNLLKIRSVRLSASSLFWFFFYCSGELFCNPSRISWFAYCIALIISESVELNDKAPVWIGSLSDIGETGFTSDGSLYCYYVWIVGCFWFSNLIASLWGTISFCALCSLDTTS